MPEPRTIRVFLSTVSDEFRTYRDLLRSDLTRQNLEVKVQEDFKDLGVVTLEKLDAYIKLCDAVVHLVGDMTGSSAGVFSTTAILDRYRDLAQRFPPLGEALDKGDSLSYTQWEAWLALYHGKILLIAKADDAAPRGPSYAPTDESRAAQQAHLARLRTVERYPGSVFTSPDNLAKQIALTTILDLLAKAQSTSGPYSRNDLAKAVGFLATAALCALPIWFAAEKLTSSIFEGPLRTLFVVVVGLCIAAIPVVYKYYLGVLDQGAKPEGSLERQDYDRLRASLVGDNLAARLYAKWLTKFLDWIERFFGDVGMADRTLFPHAFGLKTPAPLWTAPALDRCLLLALIYPIATIILIWAISGHVGPAEAALGLKREVPGWSRGLAIVSIGFSSIAFFRGIRARMWKSHLWIAVAFAGIAIGLGAGANANAVGVVVALAIAFIAPRTVGITFDDAFAGAVTAAIVVAVTVLVAIIVYRVATRTVDDVSGDVVFLGVVLAFAFIFAFIVGVGAAILSIGVGAATLSGGATGAGVVGAAIAVAIVLDSAGGIEIDGAYDFAFTIAPYALALVITAYAAALGSFAARKLPQGAVLSLFLPAMILTCFVAATFLLPPGIAGSLILFLGLLTLLNAPFDWASLGLTRALLRRGLELGGWWPFFLALADACLAGVIVALLALIMVIGVQAFDDLALRGGDAKAAVLPLPALFDGIAKNPGAPEFWWAYALLLSTMIPSLINLAIGGMAFTRGIPGLGRLILGWIPEGRDVPDYRRPLAAIGLTVQMFAGAFLGIAAQALLAWGLLFHLMPWIGFDLLNMARAVADFDIPARVFQLISIVR